MGSVIGGFLPQAIGVALSPMPIIAVILMLTTKGGRTNGLAFIAGWFAALIVFMFAGPLLASTIGKGVGHPSRFAALLNVAFGLALLYLAWRNWKSRPAPGAVVQKPKWLEALDAFSPPKALGLGALLAIVNVKNLPLALSAVAEMSAADLETLQVLIASAVFAVIGSLGVLLPVLVYILGGDKATKTLAGWEKWLSDNNATIMFLLFLVLGVKALGNGLGKLF